MNYNNNSIQKLYNDFNKLYFEIIDANYEYSIFSLLNLEEKYNAVKSIYNSKISDMINLNDDDGWTVVSSTDRLTRKYNKITELYFKIKEFK